MSLSTKALSAAGAALFLSGALSLPASASYLGYANGDPQNWDFYQEQHNGASAAEVTVHPRPHHAYVERVGEHHRSNSEHQKQSGE